MGGQGRLLELEACQIQDTPKLIKTRGTPFKVKNRVAGLASCFLKSPKNDQDNLKTVILGGFQAFAVSRLLEGWLPPNTQPLCEIVIN